MTTKDENLELLELALGELSPDAEAELRLRVDASPELAAELDALKDALALARHLPVDEPSRGMDAAVMAAARRKAAEAKPARGDEEETTGFWPRVSRFLRDAVNGPQAAMATITLLVVAVGLWFVPTAHRDADDAPMRISDAVHPPEDAEPVLEPATPAVEKPETAVGAAAPVDLEDAEKRAPTRSRKESATPKAAAEAKRSVDVGASGAAPAKDRMLSTAPASSDTMVERRMDAEGAAAPRTATSSAARRDARALELAPSAGAAAPSGMVAESAEMAPPPAETTSRVGELERAFRAGDHTATITLARAILSQPRASETGSRAQVLDYLARAERARGNCAEAIRQYERLLETYPAYARRAGVEAELADCRARVTK